MRRRLIPRPLAWALIRTRRWRYGLWDVKVTSSGVLRPLGRWTSNVREDVGKDKGLHPPVMHVLSPSGLHEEPPGGALPLAACGRAT
jgi:hypothetical protein